MKRTLALLASAALLAGAVAANARQSAPTPGGSTARECWDVSTNTTKSQAPGSMASGSSGSSSSTGTVGSSPSGSSGSTAGSAGSSSSSSSSAATRPPGMLNC